MKPAAVVATLLLHAAAVGAFWLAHSHKDAPAAVANSLTVTVISATADSMHQTQTNAAISTRPSRNIKAEAPLSVMSGTAAGNHATASASEGTIDGAAPAGSSVATGTAISTPVMLSAHYAATNRKPDYPLLSRKNDEQGTVVLRVLVTADGRADKVSLQQSSGYPLLNDSAINAVQTWRFHPATRNGQPVSEWYRLAIPFTLHN